MKKLLCLLLLIGAGLVGAAYWMAQGPNASEADRFTLVPLDYGRAAEVISASGIVQASEVLPVGTELSGTVVEVLADFNQVVREGDVLLRLDDRVARQKLTQAGIAVDAARVAVKQAEANRNAAAKALQRVLELSPEIRRQSDLDVVESQLQAAEVGVEAARVRVREAEEARRQAELGLKLHTVRAPVLGPEATTVSTNDLTPGGVGTLVVDSAPSAGPARRSFTVLDRRVSLNQEIGPPASAQLFSLAGAMDRMQVQARVAEGDVTCIHRGQAAEFTVPGTDGDPGFKGTVEEVRLVPMNDRGAVFYKVIVDVRNERDPASGEWRLRPGLTASVDFVRRAHDGVWMVPAAAFNFQPEPATLSPAARAKLAQLPDARWKAVWVIGADDAPWPVFVRTGGVNARNEAGVQDARSSEVLEWESGLPWKLDPAHAESYPRLIIAAQGRRKSALFSPPNIKF